MNTTLTPMMLFDFYCKDKTTPAVDFLVSSEHFKKPLVASVCYKQQLRVFDENGTPSWKDCTIFEFEDDDSGCLNYTDIEIAPGQTLNLDTEHVYSQPMTYAEDLAGRLEFNSVCDRYIEFVHDYWNDFNMDEIIKLHVNKSKLMNAARQYYSSLNTTPEL